MAMVVTSHDHIFSFDRPVTITETQIWSRTGWSRLVTIIETQTLREYIIFGEQFMTLCGDCHMPPCQKLCFLFGYLEGQALQMAKQAMGSVAIILQATNISTRSTSLTSLWINRSTRQYFLFYLLCNSYFLL